MGRTPRAGDESRTGVRQQGVVADIGRRALETDDFDALLHDAVEAIVDASCADYCVVAELLPGSELARVSAGADWSGPSIESETVTADRATHLGSARGETSPVVASDLVGNERFAGIELLERHDVSSGISVAIGPAGDPWGVLGAYATEPDAFPARDVNFVSSVAHALASGVAAERAGHRSERDQPLTEQIIETVGDGVYALDDRDRFVLVNNAFCELTGYDREELLGAHASLVHNGEVNERAGALAEATTPGDEEAVLEVDLQTAEGETIPVESRFVPYEYRKGRQGRTGIVRDITDRKKFEETLTALYDTSRELFRAASEEEVTALVVQAGTEVLDFTDVSLYLRDDERGDLYPAEKATEAGFMWDELPRVPPDDSTLVGHAYASGRSVLEDDIRQSPYFIDEETDMRAGVYAPIGDYGVVFAGSTTIGAFDERSRRLLELLAETAEAAFDRLDRERQLAESERRYRTLAEHFPNGAVGVYDADLRYTLAEGIALGDTLPGADRLEGDRMPEIFPEGTVADLEPLFRAAIEEGETGSRTTEFAGRNWQVWATPLRDADAEIFAGLSFAQDVTERIERERRLEELVEQLEASNERLEQFAYAASHDLQEPLRMVSSYLQLIEARYADALDDEGREFLEFAVDGADRMRGMIASLLEYSRVETRGEPFEPVDLDAVLDDVVEDLQLRIAESDAAVSIETLPTVHGDEQQLRQVFQNLLDNALEYSGDEPPLVEVTADRADDRWLVSVTDEGVGVDPDDADRIFDVFHRLHSREEHPGTGIGLSLCERIVERHGGDIWVDSEPGEGATFSFTLPAADGSGA